MPIAESSPPMVVGIRQTSSAISTVTETAGVAVDGEGLQRDHHDQEDDREAGEQDVQGDLVGRLLALGALDQRDHAVQERLTRIGRDAHHDLVGQHARAAGDGAAVAAALADDRRGLAGDGRLVHRGDALDDLAVAGDHLARGDDHDVALAQLGGRHSAVTTPSTSHVGQRSRSCVLRSVSAWALPRPSAMASAKLAKSTVNHSQPLIRPDEQGALAAASEGARRRRWW